MKDKSKKILISAVLILLSYSFIIYKIAEFRELNELLLLIGNYSSSDILLLAVVLFLMIFNWSVETVKWRVLINEIQHFSFIKAFKIVFAGITVGIFTPNRVGEIGGRVLFMEKGKRTYGVLATGIGSFAQFITSIIAGVIGFVILLLLFPNKVNTHSIFNSISAIILISMSLVFIWAYFKVNNIKPFLLRFSFFKKRTDKLDYLSDMKTSSLIKVLTFSFLRYVIFVTQFYILLFSFDIRLTVLQAYISISLIYLFATLIPTTTLAELGIRGSLAIFFIGFFSGNILGIVLSTFVLWFINLAIPSIIGSVYLIKIKF